MLVLTRKIGERVVIGSDIEISVIAVQRSRVRLGFAAPRQLPIRRKRPPETNLPAPRTDEPTSTLETSRHE